MKKILCLIFISVSGLLFAQTKADSTKVKPNNIKTGPGTSGTDTITDTGIAIAPSSMNFRVKPGKTETQYLTITNDTKKSEKFKISFMDYSVDKDSRITSLPDGVFSNYGLTKYIVAAPTLVDLKAGEKRKVAVTISMPEGDEAYRALWTNMIVDRVIERDFLKPDDANDNKMQMGVIPTFGFAVHVYQNPPNVKVNKVEIQSFNFTYDDTAKYVTLKVRNSGDGMGFCKSYVELNNLNTGKSEKHLLKQFVVFPGAERGFEFKVPGKIAKGKYSIMLVLDFGSKEQIEAAEMELNVE